MKKILILVVFATICNSALAQRSEVADPSKKNDQEAKVVHITPGSSGVKRGIGYKFLLRRGDEDPGNGLFRFNDDNVSDVRFIYVDNLDVTGEDQTKFYSSWDKTTGATARGRVTIADANGKVITVFYFKGVFIDGKGYWKLPVEYVSGVLPIDGHVYYYVFDRITNKEETVNASLSSPVIPASQVVPVTEVIPVNPANPIVGVVNETVVDPVAEVVVDPVVPVIPVTDVVPVNPVVPVTPVTEVVRVDPVVPVTPVTEVAQVNPVVPVTPVTEVTQVNSVVPVTPVTEVAQVNPVVPVTEVVPAKPAIPSRQRKVDYTERPDTVAKPAVQVNTPERTRPLGPVRRDAVDSPAPTNPEKPATQVNQPKPANPVNQPKPVNPISQAKPVNPGSQAKPTNPVSQPQPSNPVSQTIPATRPKPTNPVSQTYPANQENQNYPAPETNRLPSYQRYTGTSGGIHGKWYRGIIEVGYGLGVSDYGLNNFRFNFINGFKIGSSSLGLGVGYRRYFTENNIAPYLVSKKSEVPVFLDFRTHFSDRKVTPYFAIGAGGTASADTTISGKDRLFFTTSGGIWFNMSDSFAVFAGIAYELQKLEFSDTNPYTGNYRKNSNSISLNIGIAF